MTTHAFTFNSLTDCCSHDTFKHCRTPNMALEIIETFFTLAIKGMTRDAAVLDDARAQGYNFSTDTMAKLAIAYKNRKQLKAALTKGFRSSNLIEKLQASHDKGDFKKNAMLFLHLVASTAVWNMEGAAAMHSKLVETKLTGKASIDFKKLYSKARQL